MRIAIIKVELLTYKLSNSTKAMSQLTYRLGIHRAGSTTHHSGGIFSDKCLFVPSSQGEWSDWSDYSKGLGITPHTHLWALNAVWTPPQALI